MEQEERDAKALEAALRAGNTSGASQALGKVAAGCASCHARYRDVPRKAPRATPRLFKDEAMLSPERERVGPAPVLPKITHSVQAGTTFPVLALS